MEFENNLASSYCVKERKPCIGWVDKYLKDCLCNSKDEASFSLGIVSLFMWGVAELPQILTNFKTKSGHGISIIFLFAWVLGDIFNLLGCLLEPATLPTQLYTAVLYTATTSVLLVQSIYYEHVRKWMHIREPESEEEVEELEKPLKPHKPSHSAVAIPRKDAYYYTSARSMAGSFTPPFRSFLWPVKSGPSAVGLEHNDSSDEDDEVTSIPVSQSVTRPKQIPRLAGAGAFVVASMSMPSKTKGLMFTARKLLQEHGSESVTGQWLGWMMAGIYMGGRLPQIYLNIKRGSVEGLNPLMFIFALAGNSTYVASILVRTVEWEKIKANLPWLLDAVVCVMLDFFIVSQFVYYKYLHGRKRDEECESSWERKH